MRFGTAVRNNLLTEVTEDKYNQILNSHFDTIFPEWESKYDYIYTYNHGIDDLSNLVKYADNNNKSIIPNGVIWHRTLNSVSEKNIYDYLDLLTAFQFKEVELFSELISDNGKLRSCWTIEQIAGFLSYWRSKNPHCLVYYTDYNVKSEVKFNAIYQLLSQLKVDGLHIQLHTSILSFPTLFNLENVINRFRDLLGIVSLSEIDIRVNKPDFHSDNLQLNNIEEIRRYLHGTGLNLIPTNMREFLQEQCYLALYNLAIKTKCAGFYLWGFTDKHHWITGDSCCIYDAAYNLKSNSFKSIIKNVS